MAGREHIPVVAVCAEDRRARRIILAALRRAPAAAKLRICETCDDVLGALRDGADCAMVWCTAGRGGAIDLLQQASAASINTPVVVLLAGGNARLRRRCLDAGAFDCLDAGKLTSETVRLTLRYALRCRGRPTEAGGGQDGFATGNLAEAIIRASPLAIVCLDTNYRVRLWNAAAERMFGWSAQEMLGRELRVVPPSQYESHKALREAAMRGRTLTGIPLRRQRKDGSIVDVSLSTAPLRDHQGRTVGVVGLLEDTTETKLLQEHVLRSQRMETVARLAKALAHDLNNAMAIIHGYAEAIMRRTEKGRFPHDHAREIVEAAARCSALTGEILSFSGQHPIDIQLLDMATFIEECRPVIQNTIGPRNKLVIDVAGPCPVHADRRQLEQMLINFAINARDAMPRGGTLTVSTKCVILDDQAAIRGNLRPGNYVKLTVADTGVGMEHSVRQRVFEPFFTTRPGQRQGLGLTIAWETVRAHGGTILVQGDPGTGAAFDVLLPAAQTQDSASQRND